MLHDKGLDRCCQDEKCETSQGGRSELQKEDNKTNDHLNWGSPGLRVQNKKSERRSRIGGYTLYGRTQHKNQYVKHRSRYD